MYWSYRYTYLTTVSASVKDGGRDGDDLVAVDIGPAACAETSFKVSALSADGISTCDSRDGERLHLHDRCG